MPLRPSSSPRTSTSNRCNTPLSRTAASVLGRPSHRATEGRQTGYREFLLRPFFSFLSISCSPQHTHTSPPSLTPSFLLQRARHRLVRLASGSGRLLIAPSLSPSVSLSLSVTVCVRVCVFSDVPACMTCRPRLSVSRFMVESGGPFNARQRGFRTRFARSRPAPRPSIVMGGLNETCTRRTRDSRVLTTKREHRGRREREMKGRGKVAGGLCVQTCICRGFAVCKKL